MSLLIFTLTFIIYGILPFTIISKYGKRARKKADLGFDGREGYGAAQAAERLKELPAWKRAGVVKANPDSPQRPVRS
jgi:5-formyltetrahydrofolate cyclo-ligase